MTVVTSAITGLGLPSVAVNHQSDEHRAVAVRTALALSFYDLPSKGYCKPRTLGHQLSISENGVSAPL